MIGFISCEVMFFAIPLILIVLLGISIYRYVYARIKNKEEAGTFSKSEMEDRKIFVIICAIPLVVFVFVVVGFIALLFSGISYM